MQIRTGGREGRFSRLAGTGFVVVDHDLLDIHPGIPGDPEEGELKGGDVLPLHDDWYGCRVTGTGRGGG